MASVTRARLKTPRATAGEVIRHDLQMIVHNSSQNFVYIHAGAGYGKTTLLSQIARSVNNTIWLTLDGENDVFTFVNNLSEAIKLTFPTYDFNPSEYLPFENKTNFTTLLANAFLCSIENLPDIVIVLDDFHTIKDLQIRRLVTSIIKYLSDNLKVYISSREAPGEELIPLKVRGGFLELTQKELAFTPHEVTDIFGFQDKYIYQLTEGWPLAIGSFRVLMDNGTTLQDIPVVGKEALYSYLFYECLSRLPEEMVDFLHKSACFDELDEQMLDMVLAKNDSRSTLENLVARNIFTSHSGKGLFRYHPLFKEFLLRQVKVSQKNFLLERALNYYYEKVDYAQAAHYALLSSNLETLQKIILSCYKSYLKEGHFNELRLWFQALEKNDSPLSCELLVAKGALLSSIGNFTAAKTCLDTAIPLLVNRDQELYIEAMVHKARVLRNFISFEESNLLLDELISQLGNYPAESAYAIVIEKLHNLCLNSQANEAYTLADQMIQACARKGELKVKTWFERYLSTIHFFAGRMKDSVYYYEQSLELPESERQYLSLHSIGIFAAKAYQMLGERDKAVDLITSELQKLRSTGRYEELWLGYLFAAEIYYQNAFIDRMNGQNPTFETTMRYFALADEYAPLYRQTDFQLRWAKMQRLIYTLILSNDPQANLKVIEEIYANLDQVGPYFQTIALARLYSYFTAVSDFPNAVQCAKRCINIGEKSNLMLLPTMAYGILSRAALAMNDKEQAIYLVQRFLRLCSENGIYEYFRLRKAYDPILEFAFKNGIEIDFTNQMMKFAGYQTYKAYIETFGGLTVYPYDNRTQSVKLRTKKERELLAFLLDQGSGGATKEQIYQAIWSESESDDIKKLIGVNLSQIKKDLNGLGIENPIKNQGKHYFICRDEILLDVELLNEALKEFQLHEGIEAAQKILALYKGEYLADFEALWAIRQRLFYSQVYEAACEACKKAKDCQP